MTLRLIALAISLSFLSLTSIDLSAQNPDISGVNFYFPTNAYRPIVTNDMESYFKELKSYMADNEDIKVKLDGFAQDGKNEEWNTRVSKYRVRAMRDILIDHGIKKSRIEIEYFGKAGFLSEGEDPDDKAKNRRVELRVKNADS